MGASHSNQRTDIHVLWGPPILEPRFGFQKRDLEIGVGLRKETLHLRSPRTRHQRNGPSNCVAVVLSLFFGPLGLVQKNSQKDTQLRFFRGGLRGRKSWLEGKDMEMGLSPNGRYLNWFAPFKFPFNDKRCTINKRTVQIRARPPVVGQKSV